MWCLEVNPDKSKIVVFRTRGLRVTEKWLYGDKSLEVVTNFNYLGTVTQLNNIGIILLWKLHFSSPCFNIALIKAKTGPIQIPLWIIITAF